MFWPLELKNTVNCVLILMAGYIWAYANKNLFQSLIISLYSLNKMHWYWVYVKKRPVISFSKKINSKYTGENHFLVKKIYRPTHKFKFNSIVRWFFFLSIILIMKVILLYIIGYTIIITINRLFTIFNHSSF